MGMQINGLMAPGVYEEIKSNGSGALYVTSASGGSGTMLTPGNTVANSPLNATSVAYESSRVVKAAAGTFFGLTLHNSLATTQFVQFHNAAALPADGAIPAVVIAVPANTNMSWDSNPFGRYFSNGIVICNSTTGPTKTIGAANLWIDAQYT